MEVIKKIRGLKILFEDWQDSQWLKANPKKPEEQRKKVFIVSAPRSGSTWFLDMFQTPGILCFNESLGPNCSRVWGEKNFGLEPINEKNFFEHWQDLTEGKSWFKYRKRNFTLLPSLVRNFWHRSINKTNYHIVVKDPMMSYATEVILPLLGADSQTLLIFRNPLSIVSSRKRLGWDTLALLERMRHMPFIREKLSTEQLNWLDADLKALQPLQRMAFHTGLTHLLMDKVASKCHVLYYEDFSSEPLEKFRELYQNLGLVYDEHVRAQHQHLTQTNQGESHIWSSYRNRHQTARNSSEFVEVYKQRMNEEEIQEVIRLYQLFPLQHHYPF